MSMKNIILSNGINDVSLQRLTLGITVSEHVGGDFEKLHDMYFEAGGRSIDTARVYGLGVTEERLGRWMKQRKNRSELVITTKGGHPKIGDMHASRIDRESIMSDIKESLAVLGTDYADIYLLHRDNREKGVGEIVDILDEIVESGLAKVCGVSNWKTDRIEEANKYAKQHGKARLCVNQINFSLAETSPEKLRDDTLVCMTDEEYAIYKKNMFPVMAFSAQAKGFFAKLAAGETLSPKAAERFISDKNLARAERVAEVAAEKSISAAAVALCYLTQNPLPVSAIFSCSNARQMQTSLEAANAELDEKTLKYLKYGR